MSDQFLTTRWSLVLAAAGGNSSAGGALEQLCRDAWSPLYAFARRWGATKEDAEDAVQGFITSLISRQSLANVERGQGRFRTFLLSGMRNHMRDVHSAARAEKRGGGALHYSLNIDAEEEGYAELAVDTDTPEKAFEKAWAMEVMERARMKLRDECAASGKGEVFAALFPENGAGDMAAGEAAAKKMGLAESGFRTLAMRLRHRWRDLIREELSQTVSTREALDEEMEALRAALS
jgi:DNA-directed RNA polymerase specialized sigma24 family protein